MPSGFGVHALDRPSGNDWLEIFFSAVDFYLQFDVTTGSGLRFSFQTWQSLKFVPCDTRTKSHKQLCETINAEYLCLLFALAGYAPLHSFHKVRKVQNLYTRFLLKQSQPHVVSHGASIPSYDDTNHELYKLRRQCGSDEAEHV